MFAVIKTGGKQYKVAAGDVITIERLAGESGDSVLFDQVLMVSDGGAPEVGTPLVDGASVSAELVGQTRGQRIIIFKKRRRKNSRRRNGHRQDLSTVRITEILMGGAKPKPAKKAAKADKDEPAESAAPEEEVDVAAEAETEAPPVKDAETEASDATADSSDEALVPLFDTPAGDADDLKEISGVGPVLENKLNALGITQFAQIAGFSKEDIDRVDEVLNFKGRIEREGWLEQASKLAAGEKPGEDEQA